MAEREITVGVYPDAKRLITPFRVKPDTVLLPLRLTRQADLIVARNLAKVQALSDTLTNPTIELYTPYPIAELSTLYQPVAFPLPERVPEGIPVLPREQSETNLEAELPPVSLPPTGVILAVHMTLEEYQKTASNKRQLQRIGQFRRLIGIIDRWERNHSVDLPDTLRSQWEKTSDPPSVDVVGYDQGGIAVADHDGPEESNSNSTRVQKDQRIQNTLLPFFERIAASWYQGELAQEQFTKEDADRIREGRLPQAEPAIAAAQQAFLDRLPDPKKIVKAAEKHLQVESGRLMTAGNAIAATEHNLRRTTFYQYNPHAEIDRILRTQAKKTNQAEEAAKLGENVLETFIGLTVSEKLRASGVLYVHDPALDEPSQEAARGVKEIFNQRF